MDEVEAAVVAKAFESGYNNGWDDGYDAGFQDSAEGNTVASE